MTNKLKRKYWNISLTLLVGHHAVKGIKKIRKHLSYFTCGSPCSERHMTNKLKRNTETSLLLYLWVTMQWKAKEKYRGVFEIQKSGDKTSSGEIGLDIRTHASPKVGQDQVSGGVSVLCWHAAPVAYVPWKPCTIGKKSNLVIRFRSVMVKNWCNVINGGCHCIWSSSRMSCNIRERGTSYCLVRSPYRP